MKLFSIYSTLFLLITFNNSVLAATFTNSPTSPYVYEKPEHEFNFDYLGDLDIEEPNKNNNKEEFNFLKTNYLAIEKLINEGKFNQARNELNKHLQQNDKDPNIYNLIGQLDINEKKLASAKNNFNQSLSIKKDNLLAYRGLARIALIEENFTDARTLINKMLSINAQYHFSYLLESELFYLQQDFPSAENSLLEAHKKTKNSPEIRLKVLTILGKFYVNQKQAPKILPLAKQFYQENESNIPAISFYATNLIVNEHKTQAEQLLRKIIQTNNQDISHRVLLARLLSDKTTNYNEVTQLFDKAFSLNNNDLNILILKASYLIKLQKFDDALATVDKLISTAPDSEKGYLLKGDIYKSLKSNSLAIKMYKIAQKKNADSTAVFSLASVLSDEKKYTEAINVLRFQQGRNNNSIVAFKLARVYEKKGDLLQAEKYYQQVLKQSPTHVLSLNNLALIYINQNNPKALNLAQNAFEKASHSVAIADTYGYAEVMFGNTKKGLKILQKATEQAPDILDIQVHLAQAYSKVGNKNKAINLLKSLIENKQDFPEKENAKALLTQLQNK